MMLRHFMIAGIFLLLSFPALAGDAPLYLDGIPDMPLMAGLSEMDGNSYTFDKPDGRLIEAVANGKVKPSDVVAFYHATLPQLGWQETADGVWTRLHEKLTITTQNQSGTTYVRYTLSPEKP